MLANGGSMRAMPKRRARSCGAAVESLPQLGLAGQGSKRDALPAVQVRSSGDGKLPQLVGATPLKGQGGQRNNSLPPPRAGGRAEQERVSPSSTPNLQLPPPAPKGRAVPGADALRRRSAQGEAAPRPPLGRPVPVAKDAGDAGLAAPGNAPPQLERKRSARQGPSPKGRNGCTTIRNQKLATAGAGSEHSLGESRTPPETHTASPLHGEAKLNRSKSVRERPPLAPADEFPAGPAAEGQSVAAASDADSQVAAGAEDGRKKSAGAAALRSVKAMVNEDLQRCLDEEEVTYSWRRTKPKAAKSKPSSDNADIAEESRRSPMQQSAREDTPDPPAVSPVNPDAGKAKQKERKSSGVRFSVSEDDLRPGSGSQQGGGGAPRGEEGTSSSAASGGPGRTGGKPPRPACRALAKASALQKKAPQGSGAPLADAGSKLSLSAARASRDERLAACANSPVPGMVRLTAYDGSAPRLRASPLSQACRAAIALWAKGAMSGGLVGLHLDDWAQGEVTWNDSAGGTLQQRLGVAVGMLADASLQRDFIRSAHAAVLSASPSDAGCAVAQEILAFAESGERVVLVAEAETVLGRRELSALNEGPAARVKSLVERELLRHFWTKAGEEAQPFSCTDEWLLKQLSQKPDAVLQAAQQSPIADVQAENKALDSYLVRLLRLKRALATLLDSFEKVDNYAILGVAPTATDGELKSAYRKMCLKLHPDKGGDKTQFQQLQDAYARILEERAEKKGAENKNPAAAASNGGQTAPQAGGTQGRRKGHSPQAGLLALEDNGAGPPVDEAAADIASAHEQLTHRVDEVARHAAQAEELESQITKLRQAHDAGVEALREAQQASEQLIALSQEMGKLGPSVGEAAMEVAESSLALAARFSHVPASLLLTDVALSCTFEASRAQHAAGRLLEIKQDTGSTLQTLRTNLQMAKLIGSIDAETFKLSLNLVSKAARRIIAIVREVATATSDASERARQCLAKAGFVTAFAARRATAEEEARDDQHYEHDPFALPCPEGMEPPDQQQEPQQQEQQRSQHSSPGGADRGKEAGANSSASASMESRRQNDRLLRQLNGDLLELQRRARSHLAKQGPKLIADIPSEALGQALALAGEALASAGEAALDGLRSLSGADTGALRQLLSLQFAFVEVSDQELAMSTNPQTQLVRLAALVDAEAVIDALRQGIQARLVAECGSREDDIRASFVRVIETYFDRLCNSVVGCRL